MINLKQKGINYLNNRLYVSFSTSLIVLISITAFSTISSPVANAVQVSNSSIPTSNYAIPSSGAIFVSPNATVNGTGTSNSPLQTIAAAISITPPGGTIVLRGGTYREGNLNVYKKIVFQAYPGEQAWIDGSDIISNWVSDSAGGYKINNSPSRLLCKVNCIDHISQVDATRNIMAGSPQMVFVNDVALKEVDTREKAASGYNFFFDTTTNSLYIGVNPNGQKVEVSVRKKAMNISQSASGSAILGIGIRRFGSTLTTKGVPNESNINEWNFAAVQISGNSSPLLNITNIVVENSLFTQNASKGLYLGYADNSRLTNNIFTSNGANGFDINRAISISVSRNNISYNNTEKFTTVNGSYAVIAGSKMVALSNSTIKENIVENNDGQGLWCDLACSNVKYYSNIIRNNTERGIFYELSNNATIASNVISNNSIGIAIHGPNSKIYNNTLYKNGEGIGIFEDGRTPPNDPYSNNRSNEIVNNIIYGTNAPSTSKNVFGQSYKLLDIFGTNSADAPVPNQMVTTLDYNSYYREGTSAPVHVIGLSGNTVYQNFNTFASAKTVLNSYGFEVNGYASDNGTSEILFVDATNNNFTVKSSSNAFNSGKLLNATAISYIATDLGLNPSSLINRGAINWPGKILEVEATTTTTIAPTTTTVAPTTTTTVRVNQNPIPIMTISKTNAIAPANFTATANATDPDGSITKLEIYQNESTIPVHTCFNASSCNYIANGYGDGIFTYKVKAYDNNNPPAVAVSTGQTITISKATTTIAPTTTTTTTIAPTTTKAPPTTTTTTTIAPTTNINLIAMSKIKADYNLESIKQTAFINSVLYARAYFIKSGIFYIAADISAIIRSDGSYTITSASLILSFTPIQ